MKFFTRAWASGGLSDEDADTIRGSYELFLNDLVPKLPETLKVLALGNPSLHDGLIPFLLLGNGLGGAG